MADFYDYKDFKRDQRKQEIKFWFKQRGNDIRNFYIRNKDLVIVAVPVVGSGLAFLVKSRIKHANLKKQKDVKELYCYDRSLGHYWALRRELTNREWIEIDRRKRCGEKLADILSELKVLK